MIKRILPLLLLALWLISACTPEQVATTLSSLLTAGGGKWKVAYAKFGDEEAPQGMYDGFLIEFRNGNVYVTTNPKGAISPALLPNGAWKEDSTNRLLFDGTVSVREVTTQRTAGKIILEWEVNIPGKVTTTYRIELIKV